MSFYPRGRKSRERFQRATTKNAQDQRVNCVKKRCVFLFGVEHGGWSEIFLRSGCKGYSCIFQMEVPSHLERLVNFGRVLAAASELMG